MADVTRIEAAAGGPDLPAADLAHADPDTRRTRIEAVLGGPELHRVIQRLRAKLERSGLEVLGAATIRNPTEAERNAVARLLGSRPASGETLRVDLTRLDRALRSSRLGVGLEEVLEALGGPLLDRRAERLKAQAEREGMWGRASAHPALERHPQLEEWLQRLRASGALTRLGDDGAGLLARALEVLARLPDEGIGRVRLAAEVAGDPHALDDGRPLAGLVLGGLAFQAGKRAPQSAWARRRLWAHFGVVCDEVSCDVLTLGLRPRGRDHPPGGNPLAGQDRLSGAVDSFADAGEPLRLTLRYLQRADLVFEASRVFICENPSVVEAAASELGRESAPLVCVDGIPNTAALTLLDGLRSGGAELLFHGDFDWGGIRVGNVLAARVAARPWRYGVADYEWLVQQATARADLLGRPVTAAWDERLRPTMEATGLALYEEQVITELLEDLAP